ncbi:hypothetical protein [Sphingomonas sp. SUN039]|uniref:hypothetical protein n=1 Tax=Sphingomonas sp. SUN039 TaxID=2937787 RepID=UPI002164A7B0|nr:hypothetical protein [Sphingomonas sp. SUN039]UVO55460.1 hypothetical protein M0209_15515 [Sphingomonas sp. SUN039]
MTLSFRPAWRLPVIAALVLVAALGTTLGWRATAQKMAANPAACPAPRGIPTGFDYPQSAATVQGWVASGNVARTRTHGWNLWAALNTVQNGQPVWQSWCTETQAFASATTLAAANVHGGKPMRAFKLNNGLTTGADPINFPVSPVYAVPPPVMARYAGSKCLIPATPTSIASLANGPTLQNNGDVMVAGVIYNQPAYNWIRNNKLYQQSTLNGMIPPPNQTKQMAAMPAGSIALKPMMWPVKGSGFTALPVWDDLKNDNGVYSGFEIQSQWPRAVAVTPTPQATVAPASVQYLYGVTMNGKPLGPNTYASPRVAGVQQFYNYRPNLATMAQCDRAILDASAYYAYGRMFQQGDYLVLVAMHVMSKEQPAWTFQSVWWSDRPNAGPYAANRPNLPVTQAPGPWRNYLMTATYGIPATPGGAQWPVAYNPYIELAADHPIATNCMNCHHRAAWPAKSDEYQAAGGPGALDIYAQSNPIFNGLIGVDSLWSISDRAVAPGAVGAAKAKGTR